MRLEDFGEEIFTRFGTGEIASMNGNANAAFAEVVGEFLRFALAFGGVVMDCKSRFFFGELAGRFYTLSVWDC